MPNPTSGTRSKDRRQAAWLAVACLAIMAVSIACDETEPVQPVAPTPPTTLALAPPPTLPPAPDPNASPASCPMLNRWSSGIHNITDSGSKVIPWPIVGGHVVIDSTPLFNGRPCNAERDHCGGRKCEDPRGGEWTLLEGESPSQPRGEGYQFRIGPLVAGPHRWRVCPLRDAMDPQGVPLVTGQFACTEGVFTVLTEPPPQQ